jgi:hypothetical protein
MERDGTGDLVVTTKNLIFFANTGPVKIPAKKVISVQALSDGIVLLRDGSRAKQEIYALQDPWFAGQLISRLGRMSGLQQAERVDHLVDASDDVVNAAPLPPPSRRSAPWGSAFVAMLVIVALAVLILGSMGSDQPAPRPAVAVRDDRLRQPEMTPSVPQEKAPPPKIKQLGKPLELLPPVRP